MTPAIFPTTRRSVVLALAGEDSAARERALETVIGCYWRPLYKYARVAWSRKREEAEDLVQSFFVRALEKESLAAYDAARGGFRPFLRLLFDRYVSNEAKSARRIKRGGAAVHLDFDIAESEIGGEISSAPDPEEYFRREWVRSVFSLAVDRLREECRTAGKETHFAVFEAYDLDDTEISYRDLAARHTIPETQVTNFLAAMRRRFRALVLETLQELTASETEFRSEARALLGENV